MNKQSEAIKALKHKNEVQGHKIDTLKAQVSGIKFKMEQKQKSPFGGFGGF